MSNKARTYEKFERLLVDGEEKDKEGVQRLLKMLADFLNGEEFEEFYQHCLEEIDG